MKLIVRNNFSFCRTQVYLERFKKLEEEVNRREKEVIEKKEQLEKLKELTRPTKRDFLNKFLTFFKHQPFENEALIKERERIKFLQDKLAQIKSDGASRSDVAKRLAQTEKLNREKMFIIDMARFANKFHRLAYMGRFSPQVKLGLQLSSKNLQHKLEREGVEFLGKKDQKFNKQIHEKVDGEGDEISQILQRGIKARGLLVAKAKIQAKPSQ